MVKPYPASYTRNISYRWPKIMARCYRTRAYAVFYIVDMLPYLLEVRIDPLQYIEDDNLVPARQ